MQVCRLLCLNRSVPVWSMGRRSGGIDRFDDGMKILRSQGLSRVNPFTLPAGIPNFSAFLIAKEFQCLGPNSTIVTACATGTQAIGEGAEYIRRESQISSWLEVLSHKSVIMLSVVSQP